MVTIYNCKYDEVPPGAVYVGRPTKWGNPFTHIQGRKTQAQYVVASLDESISSYIKEMRNRFPRLDTDEAFEFFGPLVGKDLVCWCAPKGGIDHITRPFICHAQVLASLAEVHGMMKTKEQNAN